MIKKKILITAGGTGGHVLPAIVLAKYLMKKNFEIKIITDLRGKKFFDKLNNSLSIEVIESTTVFKKNLISKFLSFFKFLLSLILSFNSVRKFRPDLIFGCGGYASFPCCFLSKINRIPLIIYENNAVIGKANKYLLPLANQMLVSFENLVVPKKHKTKVHFVGNIIREELIKNEVNYYNKLNDKLNILVLGGSQAAEYFGKILPDIFLQLKKKNYNFKIIQQCNLEQNSELNKFYIKNNIDYEIFNFKSDMADIYERSNLAISRAGSSVMAELLNQNIPFISVPLPSSADNHQFHNANYYLNKGCCFMIEQNYLIDKLFSLITSIYSNKSILYKMSDTQKKHNDNLVFEKVGKIIDKNL